MHRCLFIYVHLCTHTDQLSLILEGVSQRKKYNFFNYGEGSNVSVVSYQL